MGCSEDFQEAADAGDHCGKLAQKHPDCACEAESVSPSSPGPVGAEEALARLIYSPLHVDPITGEVTEAAFSDVKDKGLSVQRLTHVSEAHVRAIGEKKLADDHALGKTDRVLLGIVTGSVAAIRQQTYETGERTFCVYDSALQDTPAHADVCQTPATPSEMKRARKRLRDLFERQPRMP